MCNEAQTYLITYKKRNAFVEEHDTSSIGIAIFTTAAARLKLFEAMSVVVDSGYCTLLYTGMHYYFDYFLYILF